MGTQGALAVSAWVQAQTLEALYASVARSFSVWVSVSVRTTVGP